MIIQKERVDNSFDFIKATSDNIFVENKQQSGEQQIHTIPQDDHKKKIVIEGIENKRYERKIAQMTSEGFSAERETTKESSEQRRGEVYLFFYSEKNEKRGKGGVVIPPQLPELEEQVRP